MSFKPITVSQLGAYVKQIFDAEELLHGISVVGEISGWSNVRGTAYFTLKDVSSALSCVCFTADKYADFFDALKNACIKNNCKITVLKKVYLEIKKHFNFVIML